MGKCVNKLCGNWFPPSLQTAFNFIAFFNFTPLVNTIRVIETKQETSANDTFTTSLKPTTKKVSNSFSHHRVQEKTILYAQKADD